MSQNRRNESHAKSVTVFFQGGLGNQLFQLAAGLDAANGKLDCIVLDFTLLNESGTFRSPEILELLNPGEFQAIYKYRKLYVIPLKILRSLSLRIESIRKLAAQFGIFAEGKSSNPALVGQAKNHTGKTFLLGYFQYSDSALKLRNLLTKVLKVGNSPDSTNRDFGYLFIHMRRGDYLNFREMYGVISESDLVEVGNSVSIDKSLTGVYVASEDFEAAARVQAKITRVNGFSKLVSPLASGVDVLRTMVDARAMVLANSSLSWWGAFLNTRNPTVYYPSPWFKSLDHPNIILKGWIPYSVNWE